MTLPRPGDKGQRWIRPLPDRLINKIAAGEVIERPAAVVKELVENSLDADATRVDIVVEKSGGKLIKIIDNGCGISAEQIEVAFGRHATSKISDFADLERIMSYGFRGEALPSIASVSRLRMISRVREADAATEIIYEGGVLQSKRPTSGAPGTTIEVENLFYNTPARRKFLKAEVTEARHISRVAMALAMGRFDVGFSYRQNDRSHFRLPTGQDLGERVAGLFAPGKEFIPIDGEAGPVKVHGFIGHPGLAQTSRWGQFLFINNRYVTSMTLSHAFAAGYGELLPKGNYPIGALLLAVDPAEVDVNVHPAKTEVRLSRERDIHDAVYSLVKEALRSHGVIPNFTPGIEPNVFTPSRMADQSYAPNQGGQRPSNYIPGIGASRGDVADYLDALHRAKSIDVPSIQEEIVDTQTGEIISNRPPMERMSTATEASTGSPAPIGSIRLLGRLSNLYLLFQSDEDLLILDQHTAHERVLFEQTLAQLEAQGSVGQHLLIPVQMELSPEQLTLFDEALEVLNKSGFGVSEFGGRTVRIEAVPAALTRKSPEKMFLKILDDIGSLRKAGYDVRKAVAQSVACRSAVMAGDSLTEQEAYALVKSLLQCQNMYSCPHGRPTFVRVRRADLDRQFGRA